MPEAMLFELLTQPLLHFFGQNYSPLLAFTFPKTNHIYLLVKSFEDTLRHEYTNSAFCNISGIIDTKYLL